MPARFCLRWHKENRFACGIVSAVITLLSSGLFFGTLNSIPRLSDECFCVILLLCETGSLYKKLRPADLV